MAINGFPVVSPTGNDKPRVTAAVLNSVRCGKLNAMAEITLTAGAASTAYVQATTQGIEKIGPDSFIWPMPLTANAAAELAAGTLYVTAQANGAVTFAHANAGSVDRTFRLLIIG